MAATQLPPDDDPLFHKWVRDIGPMQDVDLPDIRVGSPLAAAVALVAATLGLGAALGFALALVLNAVTLLVALLLIGGGTIVSIAALAYLVWRAE